MKKIIAGQPKRIMGLDIHIITDNSEELFSARYFDAKNDYFSQHSLSRTFCNFMCRQHVVTHEPELEQIGHITGVDIAPLYEMENYPDEEFIQFRLRCDAKTDQEKMAILSEAAEKKEKMEGNIDKVLLTINNLIDKLNHIDDLTALLIATDFTSREDGYLLDFKMDKGKGYIGNNFGQDLRNFARFLEFAKDKGAKTVWFKYG
jgi:hypothetical protein